jgi:general secretion pathway protein G
MVNTMTARTARKSRRGYTLIELLVVLGIVALLLTLAVPRFFPSIDAARETILAENLRNTRAVIAQFHADTGRYPDSLDQLVALRYLPALPFDPVAESDAAWIVVPPDEGEGAMANLGNVADVRSSAPGTGRNGTPYAAW